MQLTDLPALNAGLNALAATFLVAGFFWVRRRRIAAHRFCMLSAFGCSIAFLASYLFYHYHVGSVRFTGTGAVRAVYLGILLTHSLLAALVPFLAVATLYRAFKQRFDRHRALARWTLPIWLYVSVTGVVIYWMLYHL